MGDEKLRLERLQREHLPLLLEMAEEFRAEGEDRFAPLLADARAFFKQVERFAAGKDLPDDRVQQTQFLLFLADQLLGGSRLRHRLIPMLHRDGGNIGYEIRPAKRARGYGTALLGMTLREARRIGLERVLVTAERSNAASIRVIEKNGGASDGSSVSHNSGAVMRRYWIDLHALGEGRRMLR